MKLTLMTVSILVKMVENPLKKSLILILVMYLILIRITHLT